MAGLRWYGGNSVMHASHVTSDKYSATSFLMLHKNFRTTRAILVLHKGYTKFIMPAGIMSSARINSAGLIGYLMNHPVNPVTQTDQSESDFLADGSPDIRIDRIRIAPLFYRSSKNFNFCFSIKFISS